MRSLRRLIHHAGPRLPKRGLYCANNWLALAVYASLAVAYLSGAADQTIGLTASDKAPPKEVSESIRATLDAKATSLLIDQKPALEIWLRQEVPLKSKVSSANDALTSVAETTLLGVMSVAGKLQDYKGNDVPKGTYTARFGLQPQDGDHLGSADFPYFIVLIPADSDKELTGINQFRPMVKASGKATPSGHPVVLSLRPASADAKTPQLDEPAPEHKAVRLKLWGKPPEGEKASIVFDLVFQGKGHT